MAERRGSGALGEQFAARRHELETIGRELQQMTVDAVGSTRIDRVDFRVKTTESFVTKALTEVDGVPKYRHPLRELEDQVAGRVLVFFRSDLERVEAALGEPFGAVEHRRHEPAGDTEFGYESDHLVFVIPAHVLPVGWLERTDVPATFEMQVRTLFQHAWAEPQHDIAYKGREVSREIRRELAWLAASAWGADTTLDRVWQQFSQRD